MTDLFDEDIHRPRAERYAKALATAAAAEERIAALTETLADHEWHRSQAEAQVSAVEWDDLLGKVWTAADEAPPPEVTSLLDLTTGQVYTRATWGGGTLRPNEWVRADRSEHGQMLRVWPIEDAGPFIVFRDDWGFADVVRGARLRHEAEDSIRGCIRSLDGYEEPERRGVWGIPDIAPAVKRVVTTLRNRHADLVIELQARDATIRSLQGRLEQYEAADEVTA